MISARGAFLRGLGLGILAVSQPLYSLLSSQPGFFAARGADAGDILAVCFLALLPALNWGVAAAVGAALGKGEAAESFSAGAAAALLTAQATTALPGPVWAVACTVAAMAASSAARRERAREFLTWASAAAVMFPFIFLARAPWPGAAHVPPAPAGGSSTTRVVFVVLDEFPLATLLGADGAVDPLWFPSFARLSRESAWYREARSPSDDTFKALPALLTGSYPKPPKAPWHRDYPSNLFTLLAATHLLQVTETHTSLCPPALCRPSRPPPAARLVGLAVDMSVLFAHRCAPRTWGRALPSISHSWKGFHGAGSEFSWDALNAEAGESFVGRVGVFKRFAEAAALPGRPTLFFLHTMLPHPPWVTLPSGALIFNPNEPIVLGDGGREDRWEKDADVVSAAWQRHILQARATDRLLGALTDALKRSGLWEDTLLVVAADHGAAFRPGARRRALTPETAGEVIPVPLFVKFPGDGPRGPQNRVASLVDVLPTVLETQGIAVPEDIDGTSLLSPGRPPEVVDKGGARHPASAGWAEARREGDRRRKLLGDGRRPDALYRLGPAGTAVGRLASQLRRSKSAPCSAKLDQALFSPTPYSKAYVSGRVDCPNGVAGRRAVLAVIDGTVVSAGVTGPFHGTNDAPLRLMLPEDSLNETAPLELFLASGTGAEVEVTPLTTASGATWRLQGGALVCTDGRQAALGKPRSGARSPAANAKDVVVLKGDSRDEPGGNPAEEVVVLGASGSVFSSAPDLSSGRFDFALPRDVAEADGALRVFGIRGGKAWEILE